MNPKSSTGTIFNSCRGCTTLLYDKGHEQVEEKTQLVTPTISTTNQGPSGYKMAEGLVGWLFHNVGTAFFASLQRLSCINIDTKDDDLDDVDSNNLLELRRQPG